MTTLQSQAAHLLSHHRPDMSDTHALNCEHVRDGSVREYPVSQMRATAREMGVELTDLKLQGDQDEGSLYGKEKSIGRE